MSGAALTTALNEEPSLRLEFYSYGVILRKRTDVGFTEYPVSPEQVALALAAKVTFDTGLMSADTLYVRTEGVKQTVIEYRRSQKTGLFLEGSDEPVRVPLPPLLLVRTTVENRTPTYAVYAVKRRPITLDEKLYHAPLPNVFSGASVCWGTVRQAEATGCDLSADWATLLGSRFGDHATGGKSTRFPRDIRKLYIEMERAGTRVYPRGDLVETRKTMADLIGGGS